MNAQEKYDCAVADRRAQCGLPPEPAVGPVGEWFMPEGGPVSSSIRVVAVNTDGLRVRRMHVSYNGEEFFLTWDAWQKSQWRPVPPGTQLAFL